VYEQKEQLKREIQTNRGTLVEEAGALRSLAEGGDHLISITTSSSPLINLKEKVQKCFDRQLHTLDAESKEYTKLAFEEPCPIEELAFGEPLPEKLFGCLKRPRPSED